ncbi:MAG TPA: AMP-binding protein [Myxococcales bacterium]|jgi:long-chain acyl-CoA synthetase
MLARTLVHALRERASLRPDAPALWHKQGGSPYRSLSWSELWGSALRAGRGLLALDLPAGSPVAALCGPNVNWLALELGAMGAGLAVAPLYPRWPDESVAEVLRRLEAKVLFVDGPRLQRVLALRAQLPRLEHVVCLDSRVPAVGGGVRTLAQLQQAGEARGGESEWAARVDALEPEAVASFSLTFGAVGAPRIIEHCHRALVAHASRLSRALGVSEGDMLLSRLPPAVSMERAMLRLVPLTGAQLSVAPEEGSFQAQLREARPTFVHATPEDWEALRRALEPRLTARSANQRRVLVWAQQAALEAHRLEDALLPVPGPVKARLKVARTLIFEPLKLEAGLHAARGLLSGLGPVARSTLEFFASLDLPLGESWGLVEAGGPVTVNVPAARRLGLQGRPLPGIAVRIAADGEVLLRTDTLCLPGGEGPAAAAVDRQGWLHTGDLGELDPEGFLKVARRTPAIAG